MDWLNFKIMDNIFGILYLEVIDLKFCKIFIEKNIFLIYLFFIRINYKYYF